MQKLWGVLFGVIMAAAFVSFAVAPAIGGWWMPKNVSSFGGSIDMMFYIILGITGFFFVLTEAILVYAMIKYAAEPGRKVPYQHGNHQLELIWTLVPAAILLFIALFQVKTWAEVKYQTSMPRPSMKDEKTGELPLQMVVSARQWEWRVRYPKADRLIEWAGDPKGADDFARRANNINVDLVYNDDVHRVNEVHTWKDARVLVHLRTRDVLHSFFLPNLRLKQDALPGKVIPVWFKADDANTYKKDGRWVDGYRYDGTAQSWVQDQHHVWELACAEFCGDRHGYMRGKLYVHLTKDDFLDWLRQAEKEEQAHQPTQK